MNRIKLEKQLIEVKKTSKPIDEKMYNQLNARYRKFSDMFPDDDSNEWRDLGANYRKKSHLGRLVEVGDYILYTMIVEAKKTITLVTVTDKEIDEFNKLYYYNEETKRYYPRSGYPNVSLKN